MTQPYRIDLPGGPLTAAEVQFLRDQEEKWRDRLPLDLRQFNIVLTHWQVDTLARLYAAHDLRTRRRNHLNG